MEQELPTGFLDVQELLQTSLPRPRVPWLRALIFGSVVMMVVVGLSGRGGAGGLGLQVCALIVALVIFVVAPLVLQYSRRLIQAEQQAVQSVAEMVQLRRWPEAAISVQQILSLPARSPQLRLEAIVYLSAILARYHRFDDAIAIHNYLLEEDQVNPATAFGLKLGRGMSMLREDHLFDADRAISDLKRSGPSDSASAALVDMYRDVKTGHPEDAIRTFDDKLAALQAQLGHRLGDAYALAARAYDLLGRQAEAADAFRRSTLLAPLGELCRRYPEVAKLVGRYEPAKAPPEMT